MGGGSLREAPPSLRGARWGAGGETKGSGQGGARALISPQTPPLSPFGASEGMEPSARLAGLLEGQELGSTPLFCMGPRGRHLSELNPTGCGEGQGS